MSCRLFYSNPSIAVKAAQRRFPSARVNAASSSSSSSSSSRLPCLLLARGHFHLRPLKTSPPAFITPTSAVATANARLRVRSFATEPTVSAERTAFGRRRNIRNNTQGPHNLHNSPPNWIEVARFVILGAATIPFTAFLVGYAHAFAYRVEICREALDDDGDNCDEIEDEEEDGDTSSGGKRSFPFLGRDYELDEVSRLLSKSPNQVVVVAGGNESGKTRFIKEVMRRERRRGDNSNSRGIAHIQIGALVDSVSSFTSVLVDHLDLRWLRLRHQIVDVLPFAGSEILVMKERFGDRDLERALGVITLALKQMKSQRSKQRNTSSGAHRRPPVIVVDGLGEGAAEWMRTPEGRRSTRRFLQWCVYVTKEARLAHVVLTGNEQLVLSLSERSRELRGHVQYVGLGNVGLKDAGAVVRHEIPDASDEEVDQITAVFGGFIHDVMGASRHIKRRLDQAVEMAGKPRRGQVEKKEKGKSRKSPRKFKLDKQVRARIFKKAIDARFEQQVERVDTAFAQADEGTEEPEKPRGGRVHKNDAEDDDEMDPFLDPLKSVYSEAQAAENQDDDDNDGEGPDGTKKCGWTQLQLWKVLRLMVSDPGCAVPFSKLRDDVFDGDRGPILDLMHEDVLGFTVDGSTADGVELWKVTPASPALEKAFRRVVDDETIRTRYKEMERTGVQNKNRTAVEDELDGLCRKRRILDRRKLSLLRSVELGQKVGREDETRVSLGPMFDEIVSEEEGHEKRGVVLRRRMASFSEGGDDDADVVAGGEVAITPADDSGEVVAVDGVKVSKANTLKRSSTSSLSGIKSLIKKAVLGVASEAGEDAKSDDTSGRWKRAFELLNKKSDGDGMTAGDLAQAVRNTTGKDADEKAIKALVDKWDRDNDHALNWDEFIFMLLADDKGGR